VPNGVVRREEVIANFRRIHDRRCRAWELHDEIIKSVPVGLTPELSCGAARAQLWPR
jgi:hypothetical protein